ncbi:hypothetical protein [Glaciihabitans sp. UYNi722]|uniref:hypothetical protein n=1 Tax=Glaciihabitans sp. UYNi722 TaxID=3156344 RepID=UPI0033920A9D
MSDTEMIPVASDASLAKPRIRWGAIAWGLIAIAIAVTVMVIVGSADNRLAFVAWMSRLTPASFGLLAAFVVGGLVLLLGLLAVLRRGSASR